MKKSMRMLALLLCCAALLATAAYAASYSRTLTAYYRDIKLVVNDAAVVPKDVNGKVVDPFIVDGTTYLPVRAVSEALGKAVTWDDKTSTVTVKDPAPGLVGTWKAVKTSWDGEDTPVSKSFPKGFSVTLKAGGTGSAMIAGEAYDINWKEDNGALTIQYSETYNWYGTVTGDVMVLFLESHDDVGGTLVTMTK